MTETQVWFAMYFAIGMFHSRTHTADICKGIATMLIWPFLGIAGLFP